MKLPCYQHDRYRTDCSDCLNMNKEYTGPVRCSGCNLRLENCVCEPIVAVNRCKHGHIVGGPAMRSCTKCALGQPADERDIETNPYSPDEAKVAHYLVERTGIGGGNTPVEFLIISHRALGDTIVNLKARISELSATAIESGWCRDLVLKKLGEILKD